MEGESELRTAQPGTRVWMIDPDEGQRVEGAIVGQMSDAVAIKWDDLLSAVPHFEDEWPQIHVIGGK